MIQKTVGAMFAVVLCTAACGQVYFYDGFLTGAGGYGAEGKLPGKSSAAAQGFSGNWSGDTGTIFAYTPGLSMPDSSEVAATGGGLCLKYSGAATDYRGTAHALSSAVPSTGTVYLMALMRFEDGAFAKYASGVKAVIGFGGAVSTYPSDSSIDSAGGVWFGFRKSDSAALPFVKVNTSYHDFSAAVAGTTYFCEAKIEHGAGAGGKTRVSWNIRTVAQWNSASAGEREQWAGTSEVDMVQFTHASVAYSINSSSKGIWFDEFRCASTYYECTGAPLPPPPISVESGLARWRNASEDFSPATFGLVAPGAVVTAPEFVNPDGSDRTLRCLGYRFERKVDGVWEVLSNVTDRTRSVTVPVDWHGVTDDHRVIWQWDECPYLVECAPGHLRVADLLRGAGYTDRLAMCETIVNACASSYAHHLFDGVSWTRDDGLRELGKSGYSTTIELPQEVFGGDEIILYEYRLSPLSCDENSHYRMPTAWTLSVRCATDGSGWRVADATNGVDISRIPNKVNPIGFGLSETDIRFDIPLAEPVVIEAVKFEPSDSSAHRDAQTIQYGLMELDLLVGRANARGTLRVSAPGMSAEGFSHADRDLLSEAATLTAPATGLSIEGYAFPACGYRLESFDEATGRWTVRSEDISAQMFEWTPDPTARLRLTWLYNRDVRRYVVRGVSEGQERIVSDPASEDGLYDPGTEVTLTANPDVAHNSRFVRWIGEVEGLDDDALANPVITVVADRPRRLMALFERDWVLDTGGESPFVSDGNWKFGVTVDPSARSLAIGKWQEGGGRLNLDTSFSDGTSEWTVRSIDAKAVSVGDFAIADITELILPKTLRLIGDHAFRGNVITNLVMDCPLLTYLGTSAFARNYNLAKAVVRVPSLSDGIGPYSCYGWSLTDADLSGWDLSALKIVPEQAFTVVNGETVAVPFSGGVLELPRVETVGLQAFVGFIQAAEIRIGTAKGRVRAIGQQAFENVVATNLVLGCRREVTADTGSFTHAGGGYDTIRLIAYAPADRMIMDRMLRSNTPTHMAKVYVSKVRAAEWKAYVTPTADIDDAGIKAQAEALGAWGAYKAKDVWGEAYSWKAYFFPVEMPLDPKGFGLIVR